MAEATAVTDPDPFAPIFAGNGSAANPDAQDNPFASIMPKAAPEPSSATGAFLRGAERSAVPAIGSLPAIGAGAEAGAALGALGGPLAEFTVPAGAVLGGFAGALGGSTALTYAQNWALSKLPESWRDALGLGERQERADVSQHPIASFIGGIAPYALTMRPGAVATRALPDNATAFQRLIAHPATARVFGGAALGGMELGQEAASNEDLDWRKAAIATGFGLVFNKPTRLGEALTGLGAHAVRGPVPTVAQAGDAKVAGPGITEDVFQGSERQSPETEQTAQDAARAEQTLTAEPPAPDVRGVARRMHPELFDRYDALVAQRDAFRNWIEEYNNPSPEAVQGLADQRAALEQQLETHIAGQSGYKGGPEARRLRAQIRGVQAEQDALSERAAKFQAGEAEETADLAAARKHLQATDIKIRDMLPEVQAAYRRAAEAGGTETVEAVPYEAPEVQATPGAIQEVRPPAGEISSAAPVAEQPAKPASPVVPGEILPVAAKPIAEQKAAIAKDVAAKLIAAGRPAEEAEASGHLVAARYATRAAQFKGALGTAEELYAREAAEIRGPSGAAPVSAAEAPPVAPAPAAEVAPPTTELAQRKADEALRAKVAQKAADEELFGSDRDQKELFQRQHQTQTPEFKKWFGDSKVVDADGDPQVVYHGTDKNFRAFNKKKTTQGIIWFTSNKAAIEAGEVGAQGRGRILDLYASLKNPAGWAEYDKFGLSELKSRGYDGAILPNRDGTFDGFVFEPTQLKSASKNVGTFDPDNPSLYSQGVQGKILLRPGRRPIITLMKDANASTFIHETGHEWLEQLLRDAEHPAAPDQLKDDAATVVDWLGVHSADDIKTRHHEKFARGFEQYLREGVAPSAELAGVFAKFKNWLLQIYQTIKGLGKPINDDIRSVFDRMLAEEPQRTVIAPDIEPAKSLADLHEHDAAQTEPEEALPAADRIASERQRTRAESSPEIAHEVEPVATTIGTSPGADTGAETGERPGGSGDVAANGGAPEPKSASSGMGAQHGPVSRGGSEAETSGAGVSERGAGPERANPLAPRPAERIEPTGSALIDKAGNIRLDNLTTREDVKQAIREAATANDDFIGERRGVVTDGQIMDLADALGMDFQRLNSRKIGEAFNAEQVIAARKLLIQSATNVASAMKMAATGNDADVLAYAEARDRHQMIQAQVAGITAEAGRALRAFRNISGQEGAESIDQFIRNATGKTLFQLRREAQLGMALDTPQQVSKFVLDASKRSFGRMLLEYWINGLISGPATHATYSVGNALLALNKAGPETAAAALIGRIMTAMGREGESVRAGEIGARLKAGVRALPSALEAAGSAMKSGVTTLLPGETPRALPFQPGTDVVRGGVLNEAATYHSVMADTFGAIRGIRDGLLAGAALLKAGGIEGSPLMGTRYSALGAIPDLELRGVNVLPIGTVVRLPGRAIAGIHSFFRAVNYSMEKSAIAYRTAVEEGLAGNAFDARIADLRQNPTPDIMEKSRHEATELTLMGQGGEFVRRLSALTNATINLPVLGETQILKFIDPFVHIAGNVIDQSIIHRSPVGLLSPTIRADLMGKNGNVAQDMAAGRMLAGTALALTFGGLAAEGYASGSGPSDPKQAATWRLAGNQAHSVRIGDIWYDVHRLGPLGMLTGIAADMYEVARTAEQGEYVKAAAAFQHALVQNILDESFVRGPAELLQAVEDPGRYGAAYVRNFLSSFVPYSVGMAQVARAADPYTRQARTLTDAIKAKVPGISESLLPRRDIWGNEMPNRDVFGMKGVSSIYETQVSRDPINQALLQLGIFPAQVPRSIRNVKLTDQQYDDFARIAGRMTKIRLDAIVHSPDWRTWAPHVQRTVIEATIKQSRETARNMMFMKYPQILSAATAQRRDKLLHD